MLTSDVERLMKELDKGRIFLPLGDWVEIMKYGASNHYVLKFSGPVNNTVERAEACPVVHDRDFGHMALFFLLAAKRFGTLGDIELAIREILVGDSKPHKEKSREEQILQSESDFKALSSSKKSSPSILEKVEV